MTDETKTAKSKLKTKLPGDAYAENIRARFWLMGKGEAYVGIGRITLLEKSTNSVPLIRRPRK